MPCRKSCEKLWNNYLTKYGDFRERLQIIRNDHQCFMQFQLPRIKQQSLNVRGQSASSVKELLADGNNRKSHKNCDPLLPSECCHSSIIKNNRSFTLNTTDLDKLEKLIEAENFPDNIFPVDTESRPSIDNEIELSMPNNLHRLTSPLDSMFSKNNVSHSITQNNEGSSIHRSIQKSELVTSSHDPTASRITNPYAQLIERLRKAEKSKLKNSDTKIDHKSFDSTIDEITHLRIQKLLSFLHSLDDMTDINKQNSNIFDENILIALFSIDNHLSSSTYVPTNIQQLNFVPKNILQSLRNTPDNEYILNKIQNEISRNKTKEFNPEFLNKSYSNDDQDNELNSRLFNTYTIKAFKDFLIHHNKSARLPKLFDDIDRLYQQ